jgi:MOSC domain-containing protein YiiM
MISSEIRFGRLEAIWLKRVRLGPMDLVPEAELRAGRGIAWNADFGGRRQVTILDAGEWERRLSVLGSALDPSFRRANLLVRGVDLAESRGRILALGQCRIRIDGETKPCALMDEVLPGLRGALYERWGGGAWGAVVTGGRIALGDPVGWADVAGREIGNDAGAAAENVTSIGGRG